MANEEPANTRSKKTLAQVVRAAREAAGLSVRQLGPLVGVNASAISRIESGESARPSAELLQNIAEVLEIDPSELLIFVGIKPSNVLPKPRAYFRRAYGMTDEEAAAAEKLIAEMRANRKQDE
ncbi:helix-turn-helix transcriptional regulator [Amycolatopsis sp. NPDC051716]|uniref:helix-turn-helix domain-containing protein n=1 Tax=Amycolatopsis sp. NPDC051716 TaxID=3155804 RepID=UPI00342DBE23